MVKIRAFYEGGLHCRLVHDPSGAVLPTDAPKDNMGKGESFSPTDLVASALLTCMLTTMAISAKKEGWEIGSCEGEVVKEMVSDPLRRIGTLTVTIRMPKGLSEEQYQKLEQTALSCPVAQSLSSKVAVPTKFEYLT
jgi:putative redox protein